LLTAQKNRRVPAAIQDSKRFICLNHLQSNE
jgi:hypothetical protein